MPEFNIRYDDSGGSDVGSGADRHLDKTFRLQVAKSSSLVSILFREAFGHGDRRRKKNKTG